MRLAKFGANDYLWRITWYQQQSRAAHLHLRRLTEARRLRAASREKVRQKLEEAHRRAADLRRRRLTEAHRIAAASLEKVRQKVDEAQRRAADLRLRRLTQRLAALEPLR